MIILGPSLTKATDRALEMAAQIIAGNGSHGIPIEPKDYQCPKPDAFEGGSSFVLSVYLAIRAIRFGHPKETRDDIRLGFKEQKALLLRMITGKYEPCAPRTYWNGCAKLGRVLYESRMIGRSDGVFVYCFEDNNNSKQEGE